MHASMPQEIRQVLKGLTLNRQPGLHFPGSFLELSFEARGGDDARLTLCPDRHCLDADGQTSLAAVGLLADIGMSAFIRQRVGNTVRLATVSMTLQFSGAPRVGLLEALGDFDGFHEDASGRLGLARAQVLAGGRLLCTATGSFMVMENKEGTPPMPMWRRSAPDAPLALLSAEALTDQEQIIYRRAIAALEPGPGAFIERFWMGEPRLHAGGAVCDFVNGQHVGNRVGHTQGGIAVALAANTANAAVGEGWCLSGLSSWYVRPGTGPTLQGSAEILHQGGSTAVVQTRLADAQNRTVLMTTSSHVRRVGGGAR